MSLAVEAQADSRDSDNTDTNGSSETERETGSTPAVESEVVDCLLLEHSVVNAHFVEVGLSEVTHSAVVAVVLFAVMHSSVMCRAEESYRVEMKQFSD